MSLYDSLVECVQIGTTFLLNLWLRRPLRLHLRCAEHIFDKDSVARCRVVYENVRHRTDKLAVLDDGRAAHECGQEGTTNFNRKLMKFFVLG